MNALSEVSVLRIKEILNDKHDTIERPADIIADIIHFCRETNIDFMDELRIAMVYYLDETSND